MTNKEMIGIEKAAKRQLESAIYKMGDLAKQTKEMEMID